MINLLFRIPGLTGSYNFAKGWGIFILPIVLLGLGFVDHTFAAIADLDTSFNGNGVVITDLGGSLETAFSVALQRDGKIVAGGFSYRTNAEDFALARYNSNGTLDTTFSTDGKLTTNFPFNVFDAVYAIAIQSDNKIVAGGKRAALISA